MATLLLGITLLLFGLSLAGVVAISNTVLGILLIITGILYIVSSVGVTVPALPIHHRVE